MVRKSRFQAVAKLLKLPNGSYHATVARGGAQENRDYCTKLESRAPDTVPMELGQPITQGQRSELMDITELIKKGASTQQIAMAHPVEFIKFHRGIASLQHALSKPRDSTIPNIVWLIWGGTGTGKTTKAHAELKARFGDRYYVKEGQTQWWDNYQNQKGVLIDDYNGGWSIDYLLTILHEHPEQVQVKGSFVNLSGKFVIITSNKDSHEWYPNADSGHRAALERRITRRTHIEVKAEPTDEMPAMYIPDSDEEL